MSKMFNVDLADASPLYMRCVEFARIYAADESGASKLEYAERFNLALIAMAFSLGRATAEAK